MKVFSSGIVSPFECEGASCCVGTTSVGVGVKARDDLANIEMLIRPILAEGLGECRVSIGAMTVGAAPIAGEHQVERLAGLQKLLIPLIRIKIVVDGRIQVRQHTYPRSVFPLYLPFFAVSGLVP